MTDAGPGAAHGPARDPAHDPARRDSAGVPWAGRTLTLSSFAGDDGSADPALARALSAYAVPGDGEGDLVPVLEALRAARVLVPVVAVLGETSLETTEGGRRLTSDKDADMALVTLTAPDGRRALPVFTSVEALSSWDAAARPVPVEARRAALSAVSEGCSLAVLDPRGPVTAVVPRPALWALAQGLPWTPSPGDPAVAEAVAAAASTVDGVLGTGCEPGRRAELCVVLTVRSGLDRDGLDAVTAAVSRALAASDVVAERVDGVELRVVSG